ncbi:MAG: hypothetical protein KJ601_07035, partial [Nanoarchaeota archaeon]|nr:hypothetical protein [Nanoarchaeota archaeon]MBU1704712.1 hypothetical protein [Nanoarchaeota archaeon]
LFIHHCYYYIMINMVDAPKAKVYVIGRIAKENQIRLEQIVGRLGSEIECFVPHQHNPYDQHPWMPPQAALRDWAEILYSDIGLAVTPVGRDCSWEIGSYAGLDKPIIIYIDSLDSWLSGSYRNAEDWMVKINPAQYATPDKKIAARLQQDPFCVGRISLLDNGSQLSELIKRYALLHSSQKANNGMVMIIDDNKPFCDSLARSLRTKEYGVVFAHTFKDAVHLYKKHQEEVFYIVQDGMLDERDIALRQAGRLDDLSSRVLVSFFRYHGFGRDISLFSGMGANQDQDIPRLLAGCKVNAYFEKGTQSNELIAAIDAAYHQIRG